MLSSNNPLRSRKEMKNYNTASKIPALSAGNIKKYEYLAGEDILPSNQ